MTIARPVDLPSAPSAGGGILDLAEGLPAGWERGVTFATDVCLVAGTHQFCPDSPGEKDFQATSVAAFEAFGVEVSVVCTALTPTGQRRAAARSALDVVAEFNVGEVLATGVGTNPSLADAVSAGSGMDAASALAVLEGAIATGLRGHLAFVHVAPSRLVELVAATAVWRDLGGWRTPGGHVVVASPGYETALADSLVATPPVHAMLGAPEQVSVVDHSDNRFLSVNEAAAIAVFDPCFNVSAEITTSP